MRKALIFFIALYLFSLTPIYKKHSPAYFKKVKDFVDLLMSPEIKPATYEFNNRPASSSTVASSEGSRVAPSSPKTNFSSYGYTNKK